VTLQGTDPVVATIAAASKASLAIEPSSSKSPAGSKPTEEQNPSVMEISRFDDTMSTIKRRTQEWSKAFNDLMKDLDTARKVTDSPVAPKY
jgi:hypothetical protein